MLRVVLILALTASTAWAVPVGIDDFEDGTTAGWHVGDPLAHPAPPVNVSTGGPAGAGDAYLQLEALGVGGPGSRLSVLNLSQWTGDFTSVSAIGMDVNNFGPDDVLLRLLFVNFPEPMGPPTDVAWTLASVIVPSGSGWTDVLFSLSAANLFAPPFGTVAGALADVDELRIFHNPVPSFGGPQVGAPPVAVTLGIDNIRVVDATAVPEPSSMLLMLAGLGAGARKMFRAKRQEQTR
jgi:hypothetical protein